MPDRLSAESLEEFCGIHLSHTTLGKIAGPTAEEISARLQNNPDVRHDFQKAKGEAEFYADGTFIHIRTLEGLAKWMEVKVGAFAKRERGESVFPSEWATRDLPPPTVMSAFASIMDKEEFLKLCQSERRRLGVGGVSSSLYPTSHHSFFTPGPKVFHAHAKSCIRCIPFQTVSTPGGSLRLGRST